MQNSASQRRRKTSVQKNKGKEKKKTKFRIGHIDYWLLLIMMALLVFGLIMLFSASYPKGLLRMGNKFYYITKQLQYVAIGLPAMVLISMVDYRILRKFAWPLMIVTLILLVIVLFMAKKNGVRRWIWFGSPESERGFQPSEIAKFALILLFAALVARNQHRIKTFKYGVLPFILVLGVLSLLLIAEPHLSCTILAVGIGVSMMFAGGTSYKWFGIALLFIVVAGYFAFTQLPDLVPYAQERINNWLNPLAMHNDDAYQTKQSLIAVGSGGFWGRGLAQSKQKYLYLPEMFNDYIFAVLCEELGMVGALAVIVLFLAFLFRGLYLAATCTDKFGSMILVGVSVQVALQAFLHMAVNTNTIPSTGISLPFFSYGGTALCMLLAQVGVMLSVTRRMDLEKRKKKEQEAAQDDETEQEPSPPLTGKRASAHRI